MNSLPHISHHLFAAAVGSYAPKPRRPAGQRSEVRSAKGLVTALPLELWSMEAPLDRIRPLRASVLATGI